MASKNDYWQTRTRKIRSSASKEANLKKLYRQSVKRQTNYINMLYSFIKDGHELTRTELYKFSEFLKFKKQLKEEINMNTARLEKGCEKALKKAYKSTFKNTEYLTKTSATWTNTQKKRMESVLKSKWSGKNYSERIWRNTNKLARDVENVVIDHILNNKSKQECISAIRLRNNVSYSKAERLIQTEISYVSNKACLDRYSEMGVEEVKVLAEVNKERCCDTCRGKNNSIVKINEAKQGRNTPPFHPNCHCDIVPVINKKEVKNK